MFRVRKRTRVDVTNSTVGTVGQQTKAAWQVSDIRTQMAGLRTPSVKAEDVGTRANDRSPGGQAELDSQSSSRDAPTRR